MLKTDKQNYSRTCGGRRDRHPRADCMPLLELNDEGIYRIVPRNRRRAEHYMSMLITRSARPVEDVDASIFLG